MENELKKRHKIFDYLYKKRTELIHLGGFGTFRLLTDHSEQNYSNPIYSFLEVGYKLVDCKFFNSTDIPFAQEFDFSDNDKILLLTENNGVSFVNLNDENSYRVIANSIEELLGIHAQIDFIISQGYDFQIITKAHGIDEIIPQDRFFNLEEGREYYDFDDYLKLLEDILNLNKGFRNNFSVQGQEVEIEHDIKYMFSIKIEDSSFGFDFLDSKQPNTINSDNGYLNSIFLHELNNIFKQIKTDSFFKIIRTQLSIPINRQGEYIAFINQNEYQKLLNHNFRFDYDNGLSPRGI